MDCFYLVKRRSKINGICIQNGRRDLVQHKLHKIHISMTECVEICVLTENVLEFHKQSFSMALVSISGVLISRHTHSDSESYTTCVNDNIFQFTTTIK